MVFLYFIFYDLAWPSHCVWRYRQQLMTCVVVFYKNAYIYYCRRDKHLIWSWYRLRVYLGVNIIPDNLVIETVDRRSRGRSPIKSRPVPLVKCTVTRYNIVIIKVISLAVVLHRHRQTNAWTMIRFLKKINSTLGILLYFTYRLSHHKVTC